MFDGIASVVDELLADMATIGEFPPVPLTERKYSGTLSLRTSPWIPNATTLLAIEAAEQGVR